MNNVEPGLFISEGSSRGLGQLLLLSTQGVGAGTAKEEKKASMRPGRPVLNGWGQRARKIINKNKSEEKGSGARMGLAVAVAG